MSVPGPSSHGIVHKNTVDIDESLYSRQLYVLGHEGQRRMAGSSVLLMGLSGAGVETAKNIILAGVKSLALFDPQPSSFMDLASQFYLNEGDVVNGRARAEACAPLLAELNPYVDVSVIPSHFSLHQLQDLIASKTVSCLVLVDQSMDTMQHLADAAHMAGVCVIVASVKGVCGSVFCDFGTSFLVTDSDGEAPMSSLLASVVVDPHTAPLTAIISTLEESRHGLESGDIIALSDIMGSVGDVLNGREFSVTVKDLNCFEVCLDECARGQTLQYEGGGYANQVKQSVVRSFRRFSDSINCPGPFHGHEYKIYRAGLMHLLFRAYHVFTAKFKAPPQPGSVADIDAFYETALALAAELNDESYSSVKDVRDNVDIVRQFAATCVGNVSPVCAFFGGIIGQEVLKACSGKFTPIQQWLYYDFLDALPDTQLDEEEVRPRGDRYDGQVAIFGTSLQHQLQCLSIFLVGAGAIGCEVLKNFALMGVGCNAHSSESVKGNLKRGGVLVTDPDQIEKSNLSRQFLFRYTDIHTPKSTAAGRAVTRMNPSINVTAFEQKVCPETEGHFNDDFYEAIDVIVTALDNVEARLYMDQKALFYHKPMLESGTLGTKGHTQLVIPCITEHYGATRDPPEKSIPMCTLKFFPNLIEHTIQWAREWFEETYHQIPSDTISFMTDPQYLATLAKQQNVKLDTLTHIQETIRTRPSSFEDCVVWARLKFEDLFSHQIQQLLYNLPLNKMTGEGIPFWSGAKKPPSPLQFSADDPEHMTFIVSVSVMRAKMYSLPLPSYAPTFTMTPAQESHLKAVAMSTHIEPFKPQDNVKIATTEEEAKNNGTNKVTPSYVGVDIDQVCNDIVRNLPSRESIASSMRLTAADFDKDIDDHIKVIASLANLRARNYKIPEVDLHKARGIAGKIIPAIATTTALVTGAVCMELFKLLLKKPVSAHCNSFFNLAIPLFTSIEPEPPKNNVSVVKGKEWKWNQWDRIDISQPDLTLNGLILLLEQEYDVDLVMLSAGVTIVFSAMIPVKKANERKAMTVKHLVETICKKVIPPSQKYLVLEAMAENKESGDEVELPYIRFRL